MPISEDENETDRPVFSDGIAAMPRRLKRRERIWDIVHLNLQIFSRVAWLPAALIGAKVNGLAGALIGLAAGWLFGAWMRYSMGGRKGNEPRTFYLRMGQRARGSRPRLLEWIIEAGRGSTFTPAKCAALWRAYEDAMRKGAAASTDIARRHVLKELDEQTKRISYE